MADDHVPLTDAELDALLRRSWQAMQDGLGRLVDTEAGLAQVEGEAERTSAMTPRRNGGAENTEPATRPVVAGRRSVVDYGLARKATLESVSAGLTTAADVCDAHPYLLRAAKYHGEPAGTMCPICSKTELTHVTYVYGDELGQYAGRVKKVTELKEMATEYGQFRVYVVEVCTSCSWNHLALSYVLGAGEVRELRARLGRGNQ